MKIILSPVKKIKVDTYSIESLSEPVFKEKTDEILRWLQGRSEKELRHICKDGTRRNGKIYGRKLYKKPESISNFNRLGYVFRDDISSDHEYIFERKSEK